MSTRETRDTASDDDQHWFDLIAGRAVPDAHGRTRADAAWLRAALLAYRAEAPAGSVPAPESRVLKLLARAVQAGVLPAPAAGLDGAGPSPWQRLWRWTLARLRRSGAIASVGRDAAARVPSEGAAPAPNRQAARAPNLQATRAPNLQATRAPRGPGAPWARGLTPALLLLALGLGLAWQLQRPDTAAPAEVERSGAALQRLTVADPLLRQQQLLRSLRAAGLDAQPFERLGRRGVDIELPVPLLPAQAQALKAEGLLPPPGPSLIVELLPPAAR